MIEKWKIYKETESNRWGKNIWEVSTFGRLRKNGEIVKLRIGNSGYYYRGAQLVHRIVAETFIDNPNNYRDVDHIDGNRLNNNVENLRWCTHKDNINTLEWKTKQRETHLNIIPWNKDKHTGNGWKNSQKQLQSKRMKGNDYYKFTQNYKNKHIA